MRAVMPRAWAEGLLEGITVRSSQRAAALLPRLFPPAAPVPTSPAGSARSRTGAAAAGGLRPGFLGRSQGSLYPATPAPAEQQGNPFATALGQLLGSFVQLQGGGGGGGGGGEQQTQHGAGGEQAQCACCSNRSGGGGAEGGEDGQPE